MDVILQGNVKNLKKLFETLPQAIDEIPSSDLGPSHYEKAKKRTLTLSLKKRERNYSDLKAIFEPPRKTTQSQRGDQDEKPLLKELIAELSINEENIKEESESQNQDQKQNFSEDDIEIIETQKDFCEEDIDFEKSNRDNNNDITQEKETFETLFHEHKLLETENSELTLHKKDVIEEPGSLDEIWIEQEKRDWPSGVHDGWEIEAWEDDLDFFCIKTDKDVAEILMDVIHEAFYNPYSGLWPQYDAEFDIDNFTRGGKLGWNSPLDGESRIHAREEINQKKNAEMERLLKSDWVRKATNHIYETMNCIVSGVRRKDVKRGIRNHIRDHLYHLIFGRETLIEKIQIGKMEQEGTYFLYFQKAIPNNT